MKDIYIEWKEICRCIERICDCVEDADFDGIKSMFLDAKPADVRPVRRGRWVWLSSTYDRTPCEMRYWCSICHHETILHSNEMSHPWERFCPNCGADMREEEQDG